MILMAIAFSNNFEHKLNEESANMNKNNKTSEQTEQTTISSSLRFGLLAAALTTLGDAIAAIAALER